MAYQIEKGTGDIVITGFEQGISNDPYEGIGNLVNINTTSIPKEASVNFATSQISPPTISAGTVSSVSGSNVLTYTGATGLENYMCISFNSSGLTIGSVSANTPYWVALVSGGTFKIYSDYAQSSLVAATNGVGTFNVITTSINYSTGTGGTPKFFTYDEPDSAYFMLTTTGDLWSNIKTTTSGYWTFCGNSGNTIDPYTGAGLAYYQSFDNSNSYVFVFRNSTIDYFIVKSSSSFNLQWVHNWNPLTGNANYGSVTLNANTSYHNAYVGQDNVLYWCDGHFIGSLFETPNGPPQTNAFDPSVIGGVIGILIPFNGGTSGYSVASNVSTTGGSGNSCTVNITSVSGGVITGLTIHTEGTGYKFLDTLTISGGSGDATFQVLALGSYTYASQALEIPVLDNAQCLAELGVNLLIGGQNNAIYPWDRTSTSFTYPILLPEYSVHAIVTVNTSSYIFCGNRGRIYITNGSQATQFQKIPDFLSGTVEPYFVWGGACFNKNQLYFSAGAFTNGGTYALNELAYYGGVWSISLDTNVYGVDTNRAIRMVNTFSYQTSTYNGYATCLITNQVGNPSGTGLYIGWNNNNTLGGIDTTTANPYAGGNVATGVINSDLIPIGTFLKPTTNGRIEFKLAVPIVNGESVQINYRQKFSDSFTSAGPVFNFAGIASGIWNGYAGVLQSVNFENSQWIQLQAVLTSTASSPSFVRLTELRLGAN